MPPITPDQQARALAEWLDSPVGTPVPTDVDPEVLETVFSLRPDLAPAPRVEVDDILAMVTTGPLAVEVIPEPANNPRPSRWLAWGGTSMLLVAVAALFAINLNTPEWKATQPPTPAVDEIAAAPELPAEAQEEAADDPAPHDGWSDADRAGAALDQLNALERANAQSKSTIQPAKDAEPAATRQQAPSGSGAAFPGDAAPAPQPPPKRPAPVAAPEPQPEAAARPMTVDAPMSGAADAGLLKSLGYADDVSEDEAEAPAVADLEDIQLDGARDRRADKKAQREAERQLSNAERLAAIQPPPSKGMPAAIEAARWFLANDDPARAAAACQQGLALSNTNTVERETLLRLLGDARSAMGDPVTASEAYQEATRLNETR